jgi:hypothetical protein
LSSTAQESPNKQLTPKQWEITNAVEQLFFIDGGIPRLERIAELSGYSQAEVEKILRNDVVVESLTDRGINIRSSSELLTTEQLSALAVFFDTKDGRSLKKKLNDIGVTTQQWDAWKRDPTFSNYLRSRAESALQTNIAETEVALMDSAHRGDISAIKLHLEMAGRWSSKTVGELNVEFLFMKILEAVQKHVKDPEAIENIANELLALAPNPNIPGAAAQPVGSLTELPTLPM